MSATRMDLRFLDFCANQGYTPNQQLLAAFNAGVACHHVVDAHELDLGNQLIDALRAGRLTTETALSKRIELYASFGMRNPVPLNESGKSLASGSARDI